MVVHSLSLQSQPDSLLRTKEQPEAPRRSKSTPISSSHLLPSKHHSPLSSSSSSFNPPSRHLESQNGAQRHSQPSPTAKRPLVTTATQQPTQQLDSIKQKLVDRAIKARLYLLHQSGPNRFLVGGDAPDSRFHVTIGPQVCHCYFLIRKYRNSVFLMHDLLNSSLISSLFWAVTTSWVEAWE